MSVRPMSPPNGENAPPRLALVPFLQVIHRHLRLVWTMALGAGVAAAAASMIVPATYESKLTILPPEQGGAMDLLGGNLQSSLAKLQIGFATMNTSDLYADMLKSRSVERYSIDKLGLLKEWKLDRMDTLRAYASAYDRLDKDVAVKAANNGLITVTTRAHSGYLPGPSAKRRVQRLSAEIGNALAEGLEKVNREKNTSRARQARIYLEQQLTLTDQRLTDAGAALAAFQRTHLAISLDDQARVGIETAGKLESELLAKEVAMGVARQSMLPDNPGVLKLQSEVQALRHQIYGLQRGGKVGYGPDSLSWGLEELPDLTRQYALLLREVKIQENVYEVLTEQLQYARVKETETMPVIQVLDEASVPAFKSSPIVRKNAALAFLLGGVLAMFLAHALDWWERYPWRGEDSAFLRGFWKK